MATYERQTRPVRGVRSGGQVDVIACNDCGAAVYDTEKHDEFHERVDTIGTVAHRADRDAGMMRPIGPGWQQPLPESTELFFDFSLSDTDTEDQS